MSSLQIGDTIKCHDPEDMIETMNDLLRGGVRRRICIRVGWRKRILAGDNGGTGR